jgi:hypothetical protein
MRFEVLTVVKIKTMVLWVIMLSSFMEESKKLDEIRDFLSIDPYKMQMILEEERKEKCHR